MKKIVMITLILLALVFASCSGTGGSSGGGLNQGELNNDEDITGNGLEVRFDIDTDWISQRRIDYVLELENSGKDEVRITRDNFRFGTSESDTSGAQSVFTSNSEGSLYSKVFKEGELVLFQNTNREFAGELFIGDWFFEDPNRNRFEYFIEIEYPYKTHVKNNAIVDLSQPRNILDITDKLDQAAPVKITDVDVNPTFREGEYRIDFKIEDRGPNRGSNAKNVRIEQIDLTLGTEVLGNCLFYVEEDGVKKELVGDAAALTKDRSSMFYSCESSLSNFQGNEPITTTLSGTLEYEYSIKIKRSINLPSNRLEEDDLFN